MSISMELLPRADSESRSPRSRCVEWKNKGWEFTSAQPEWNCSEPQVFSSRELQGQPLCHQANNRGWTDDPTQQDESQPAATLFPPRWSFTIYYHPSDAYISNKYIYLKYISTFHYNCQLAATYSTFPGCTLLLQLQSVWKLFYFRLSTIY